MMILREIILDLFITVMIENQRNFISTERETKQFGRKSDALLFIESLKFATKS